MSGWWQEPYARATPIAVPGFPRPVYPPDATSAGKRPSSKGADVEAYKRVAWRLGRWAGPASRFDRQYSNAFSHGQGGNVIDTGLAGVQRQAGIHDTGWIGQPTFDLLRSALIPAGFDGPGQPGEYAMDAYAQSLLVEAWELFEGEEPAPEPPPALQIRTAALARALDDLGYKESPAGSNMTKYGSWYGPGWNGSPWCAMAVSYWYEQAGQDVGKDSPTFIKGSRYAYVPYLVQDSRNNQHGLSVTGDPVAGDLVCYDWAGDGTYDHVGLFEGWTSGRGFTAIEGNTSTGDDSNGGEVMRRQRDAAAQATVFCRVKEP
jgi:hypothetical protein